MGTHDGHRDRVREKIRNHGLLNFQDHEILEYFLFSFVPRKDTNVIAHNLIKEFGSLANVLNTEPCHLAQVDGMTENASIFLSSMPDLLRRYYQSVNEQKIDLRGREKAINLLKPLFVGKKVEEVYAVALDNNDRLIRCSKIGSGATNMVDLTYRDIVDFSYKNSASTIILAHNHPSGSVEPSVNDIKMTRELLFLLKNIEVELVDHYIFSSGNQHFSFEENGLINRMIESRNNVLKEEYYYYE